jgi:hypothetical protein
MAFYRLSEGRVRRVLHSPRRTEEGVAPGTIALMQPETQAKKPSEIWVMIQQVGRKKRVITAWRYPGKSPVRKMAPIPEDIAEELRRGCDGFRLPAEEA